MAFEAPSGLMGKPESTEEFEAFAVEDIVLYVASDVLEKNLKKNILHIYVEGYGRYEMKIL
ncbi:MAG TPA: hypothetical protein VEF53_15755 [Patescibacteria group bacterium]|jgi:hypothetical protein|nr:hypothetical protein [Patescibacteria group bacterium]